VTWQTLLAAPARGQHIAQLYAEPGFFERAVGMFAGEGFRRGEAVIIIATPSHGRAVERRLEDQGFDLDGLKRQGQLTALDAASCLAALLVDGMPDRQRFHAVIGGAFDAAERAGYETVRAFGEMVDLLSRINLTATIRLEELWNELLAARRMSLLCGYSVDIFDLHAYHGIVQGVCEVHSDLIPVENIAGFEQAVQRAYGDVFGVAGDPDSLRRAFLAEYVRPVVMPDAEAAILAVREFLPTTTAELLERTRHYYHAA